MTDEQIDALARTVADVPGALRRLEGTSPRLVEGIRAAQEDVAECHRAAAVSTALDIRYRGA